MRKLIAVLIILAPVTACAPNATYPACITEDSQSCVWHAPTQGDTNGRSFIAGPSEDSPVTFISHADARRLTEGQ